MTEDKRLFVGAHARNHLHRRQVWRAHPPLRYHARLHGHGQLLADLHRLSRPVRSVRDVRSGKRVDGCDPRTGDPVVLLLPMKNPLTTGLVVIAVLGVIAIAYFLTRDTNDPGAPRTASASGDRSANPSPLGGSVHDPQPEADALRTADADPPDPSIERSDVTLSDSGLDACLAILEELDNPASHQSPIRALPHSRPKRLQQADWRDGDIRPVCRAAKEPVSHGRDLARARR